MATSSAQNANFSHVKSRRSVAAVRGVFWSAINATVPIVLNSLVFVVTSRFLEPADFGIVGLAASISALLCAFAPGAFADALIQRSHIEASHLDSVFWLCFGSAALLYGGLFFFSGEIASLIDQPIITSLLPVLGLRLFFDLLSAVPNALIARAMSFKLVAFRTTVATIISGALCLALLFLGFGFWALALSQLSVSVITCIVAFLSAGWRPGLNVRIQALRDISRFGIFASGTRFIQLMNLDQIIIGALAGPAPLGLYNFAKRLFSMLNDLIAGALTSVSYTLLSSLQTEPEKVREAFLLATYASAMLSFPAFAGLGAVASDLIPLIFGSHWIGAVPAIQGFCLVGMMSCIGIIQASLINSQGKSDWWFHYQALQQFLTVLIVVLAYRYGVTVIVWAIALKTLIFWPISIRMTLKLLDIPLGRYLKPFFAPAAGCVVMLLAVFLAATYAAGWPELWNLALQIGSGAVAYLVVALLLSRYNLKYAISLLRKT